MSIWEFPSYDSENSGQVWIMFSIYFMYIEEVGSMNKSIVNGSMR